MATWGGPAAHGAPLTIALPLCPRLSFQNGAGGLAEACSTWPSISTGSAFKIEASREHVSTALPRQPSRMLSGNVFQHLDTSPALRSRRSLRSLARLRACSSCTSSSRPRASTISQRSTRPSTRRPRGLPFSESTSVRWWNSVAVKRALLALSLRTILLSFDVRRQRI